MDSRILLGVLWPRRWAILLGCIVFAGLAFSVSRMLPVRYSSEGLLVISAPKDSTDEAVSRVTDTDLLRSRVLLAGLVHQLDLGNRTNLIPVPRLPAQLADMRRLLRGDTPPTQADRDDAALLYLQKTLTIAGNENSRVLTVGFEAASPDLASAVVNAVMRGYIAAQNQVSRETALRASDWLRDRQKAAQQDAAAADARVQAFQASNKLVALQAGSLAALDLSTQQAQLAAARQELAAAQAGVVATQGGAAPDGLVSPTAQALQQREADAMQRLAAASDLGSQNPRRIAIESELRAVHSALTTENGKLGAAAARREALAADRVAKLEAAVSAGTANANTSSEQQLELDRLTKDAQAKHAIYDALLTRTQDADYAASQISTADIASPAVPAERPNSSHLALNVVLGFLAGGLLTMGFLLFRYLLHPRLGSALALADATGLPALGMLPSMGTRRLGIPDLAIRDARNPLAETLRGIRLALPNQSAGASVIGKGASGTTILISSAERGEGKTSIAAAFSRRAAGDGMRVLLIEGDLHRPRLAQALKLAAQPGIESALAGDREFASAIQRDGKSGLHCLLATGASNNPMTLLTGERFAALMAFARTHYDLVVIDSPPVLRVSDAVLLSHWADRILFVVRANHTSQGMVAEALSRFPIERQGDLVTMLSRARSQRAGRHGYYAGYYQGGEAKQRPTGAPIVPPLAYSPVRHTLHARRN